MSHPRRLVSSGTVTVAVILGLIATTLLSAHRLARSVNRGPTPGAGATAADIVLWAWERPEVLGFIDPRETEVAVLVGTLRLAEERLDAHPREQPLMVPRQTRTMAVVRIESDAGSPPLLTPEQRRQAVQAILAWSTAPPGFAALQIDFDAVVSERDFYVALLSDLRRELPQAMPLSITALASWCLGDPWLSELPISEAVPMLFRMGIDDEAVRAALNLGRDFQETLCRTSYGLATDEPLPPLRPGRRLFLFHPGPWTEEAYDTIHEHLSSTSTREGS